MLDHAGYAIHTSKGLSEEAGRLVLGMAPREACDTLGRVFNLCKQAQIIAAEYAMGLAPSSTEDRLWIDIRKDHIFALSLKLTKAFELDSLGLSVETLLPSGLPATPDDFEAFLASGNGAAALLQRIDGLFPYGVGTADLALVDAPRAIRKTACENSVAARQAHHPVMEHIARTRGKGPLWRVFARLVDLCCDLPPPRLHQGVALVPAARGLYAVRGEVQNGIVTKLERVTPTDHLLAKDGVLEQSLRTLPADHLNLATALVDSLDPCQPVQITGALQHA